MFIVHIIVHNSQRALSIKKLSVVLISDPGQTHAAERDTKLSPSQYSRGSQVGLNKSLEISQLCSSVIDHEVFLQLGVQLWRLEYYHLAAGVELQFKN